MNDVSRISTIKCRTPNEAKVTIGGLSSFSGLKVILQMEFTAWDPQALVHSLPNKGWE